MGTETGFTQVRHARKKNDQQRQTGGAMRNKDGRGMGGNKMKEVGNGGVVENISVSNRFGNLTDSGETEELRDEYWGR
ncbi:hypothetical protein IGI04_001367 [Brassica rapa subsp. trilocularis]|uniref:Uncharacterized protein n=1 Tax=Brassica rapa subsp. trilocularis TaxID=1813537 RepID=A0ABQ7NUN2_BRACM|nr:hypothetical protein IGI04_001367 [Brassica rapa subsp. trilocularis]